MNERDDSPQQHQQRPVQPFQLFLKPVGSLCNLRCSYCYYLGCGRRQEERADGDVKELLPEELLPVREDDNRGWKGATSPSWLMSDALLTEYTSQHLAAIAGAVPFFSWHGGEPMLAGLPFFRRAVELQKKMVPDGYRVINGIQTNATLIDAEWAQFLRDERFVTGVSLDGPEQFHNTHRRNAEGKGSFDEVMRGITLLRRYEVPFEILCVVNSENVESPLEIYRFFRSLGASFITFLPLVERVAASPQQSAGGSSQQSAAASPQQSVATVTARSVRPAPFGRFLCAIFDEWLSNDIGRIEVQIFEEALRSAFGLEHQLCVFRPECGAVPVVDRNGDFYSCDHYVTDSHLLGNIITRHLSSLLSDPRQLAFGRYKRLSLPSYCLQCEVLDMCNGECPKNRFAVTPGGEPGLNWLCEGYRLFFNHCRPFVNEVARVWGGRQPSG